MWSLWYWTWKHVLTQTQILTTILPDIIGCVSWNSTIKYKINILRALIRIDNLPRQLNTVLRIPYMANDSWWLLDNHRLILIAILCGKRTVCFHFFRAILNSVYFVTINHFYKYRFLERSVQFNQLFSD